MTIKELENRTGMTRANIRFYEGEGLLSPKRLDNGYRDYSEEDAKTLEKIKLLRQLQLDIDTIRKVQQGKLTLEQALFVQMNKLEGDRAVMERAAAVCRELERSGVEYAVLEPRPWLGRLHAPARPGLPEPPPVPAEDQREEEPRACFHPWMRYFARALDTALYDTLINVVWLAVFRDQSFIRLQTANALAVALTGIAMLALTLALEPLWLHYWGWTPGKWLFGLKLRDEDGEKLSIQQGWERSWQLAWEGYGWNIPFWSLWRMWRSRDAALGGWNGSWNSETGCRYTKEERRFGPWAFAGARAALMAALALAMLWSMLPPCRGPLDVPEFARNYNHGLRVAEYGGETTIPTLNSQGRWVEREQPSGTVSINLFGDTTVYEEPEYAYFSSEVRSVTLRMSSQDKAVGGVLREYLTLLSLCRSTGGLNLFSVLPAQEDAARLLHRWEDFEADFLGVHISQQVESVGYEPTEAFGASLWCEDESLPHHCEKTVTFSIPDQNGQFSSPPGQSQADG